MHLRGFSRCVFVAAILLALSGGTLPSANAATTGIRYDEVTKIAGKDSNPQPGNFAPDFQAAVAAGQQQAANKPPQHHGLFASVLNAVDVGKGIAKTMQVGLASTEYYLGRLHRTDDPGAQTATIYKPDQHQAIYLNLAQKTYRIVDIGMSGIPQTAPPAGPSGNAQPAQPPQPGTAILDVTTSYTSLGPKTIENVATDGYSMHFKSAMSKSTGSCKDGSFETSLTEYVSSYEDVTATAMARPTPALAAAHPELAGVTMGCKPKIVTHTSGRAGGPGGRLVMWELVALGGNIQTQAGLMGGSFQTLIERGNVHTLGSADKNLFEIPAGFTKETASPSPAP